jgi:hypothetical protein
MATEIEIFESTNTKALWMVTKKYNLYSVNFVVYKETTNLLHFTINVQKSHRQSQCTFATCLRRWRVARLSWSSRFFTWTAATNKQKPDGVSSGDSNSSYSVNIQNHTHVHINFIFTMTKILTFPSESPCIKQEISSTRPWRFFVTWRLQWLRVSSVHCPLHPVTEPRVHILPPRRISCLRGWHGRYTQPPVLPSPKRRCFSATCRFILSVSNNGL